MRYWLLMSLWLVLVGCGQPAQPVEEVPRTDVAGLARLIHLPAQPTKAVWLSKPLGTPNSRAPGPTDHELYAVVTFAAADLEALRQQAVPLDSPVQWSEESFRPWYPPAVRDSFKPEGAVFQLAVPSYDAQPIFGQGTAWRGSFFITPSGDVLLMLGSW